ncbi:TRAP transporter substrate-binding protein DctP [Rhizobium laguerreae]|uniref:TRAP transporter substrate-binding protein DctP n=1 Tax=Rhizobium laguerreae TaxID=1076926 RepID=UPI001C8FE620|nr:TRAP transporter substrate-binding protein DctP [Rhizobium laguerreae]MBY3557347.1 TRAP transporter substrate-binding protein DctP [Rhizobium laguerreae]
MSLAKNIFSAGLALCALLAIGLSHALAQQKVSLSIAHLGPSTSPAISGTLIPLKDALEKSGQVEVTMYGAGSAYSNPDKFLELVERGVVDLAFGAQQFEAGQFPLNLLMGAPLMVNDAEKASRAYMKVLRSTPDVAAEFGSNRVVVVALAGPEQLHALRPITSLSDIKGLRILATNPGWSQMLRDLGASVVTLPVSSAYENLQKGVVDAASSSWQSLDAFKLFEVTNVHFEVTAVAPPVYLIMNKSKYESLPPSVRSIIDDFSTPEMAARFAAVWTKATVSAKAEALARGHSIIELPTAEREALIRQARLLTEAHIAELEAKGHPARRIYELFLREVSAEEQK